jgi:hypothetical protein
MRLAIGNAQWPMIWPTPYAMTTSLRVGGTDPTRLLLPVVPAASQPKPKFLPIVPPSEALAGYEPIDTGTTSGYGEISSIDRNPQRHSTRVTATNDSASRMPWGEEYNTETITHETQDEHPENTSVKGEYSTTVKLKDRTLRWENTVVIRSDRDNFHYRSVKRLLRDGAVVREKAFEDTIPRDHQ